MYTTGIPIYPSNEYVDSIPAMYAPFKNYITHLAPLMLDQINLLQTKSGTSASEELINCAWISRLITLDKRALDPVRQNEISGWPEMRDKIISNTEQWNSVAKLKLIMPVLQKRFKENYHFPEKDFHCWWYTVHNENTHLALHLINAYQPKSPFAFKNHFMTTMLQAIENALTKYPHLAIVSCGSWLNQLPKFQELWPESFKNNQKILNRDDGFGPGAWGQYMNTHGGFCEERAEILRKTGQHPYALTEAQSPLPEVISHLKKLIS